MLQFSRDSARTEQHLSPENPLRPLFTWRRGTIPLDQQEMNLAPVRGADIPSRA